ncbi:TonB-dependent receptor [Croceicoccus gelatinilyticus]|uniref:TonB-dependent receptor n=1 Tax=Croceicoccus gelatinilyticus TaxID=2835536 RepID=UPI001BCD45BB|nr:TonB-dependent receptor [Croceicoccus gelatinilyticus]MBS7668941.1 TonB-dependent receptor [Croceicoccus gelatinilyticus]
MTAKTPLRLGFSIITIIASTPALAEDADQRVIVVTAPGADTLVSEGTVVGREDIAVAGSPDAIGALTRNVAGVTLQQAQGNPWQPNLSWRGFLASPLQGQPQGLAAYLDGGRFNLPFGDTVPFDVIPDAALTSIALVEADPVFGLNALGGAVVMATATGRSDPGLTATAAYGSYDEREFSLAGGGAGDVFSAFAAVQYRAEDGWRDYSPSELLNGYVDLGYDAGDHGAHLKFVGADTDLTGNGVAPIELLEARRKSVFTWPDRSQTKYGRISLTPWVALGEETRLEGTLYYQRLKIRTVNGDAADIEVCEDDNLAGLLCLETVEDDDDDDGGEEEGEVLTDAGGMAIADVLGGEDYGVLNRGRLKTSAGGVLLQLVDERELMGGTNRLAIGLSYDESRNRFDTGTELGELTGNRSVEGLGPIIVQDSGAIAPVGLVAKTKFTGVFLSDSLPLTDRLTAEIGLRYNHANIVLRDQIGTALNGDHTFERVNPGLSLRYRATEALTLRGGYAETNRTPTPAELSCADEDAPCSLANFFIADPPLEQVVAKSWNLGASGESIAGGWDLAWQATAWRTTNSNDIQFVASEIRGRAYFRNIGSTRRQGFDLGVKARRGPLSLSAGYAFLDATFRDPLTLSSPSNPFANDDGEIEVSKGDRLSGLPRHSATFSADYDGNGFSFGGDVIARSGQQMVGDEAGQNPKVPGYALVNLRGSIDLAPGLSLFGEVRNALDTDYETFGTFSEVDEVFLSEAPDAEDPRAFGPGAPRRWTVGVKASF